MPLLPLFGDALPGDGPLSSALNEVRALETLGNLVTWSARQTPAPAIHDVVIQDEYTHDVVLALPGGRAFVFDAT